MHRLQDARGDPRAADGLTAARPAEPGDAARPDRPGGSGRFAPSPTGRLHAGSLVAAVASRCDASSWRVRIDDIDPPRVVPGSAGAIVESLVRHGFPGADAPPQHQGERLGLYRDALRVLCEAGAVFACGCSRRTLPANGHCAAGCAGTRFDVRDLDALTRSACAGPRVSGPAPVPDPARRPALRVRLAGAIEFDDRVQGLRRTVLEDATPDAVVLRRDGLIAYHLATAVDDAGFDDVVRGADLLDATAVQIALVRLLGRTPPRYAHVPVAVDASGTKLGKSSGAAALDASDAAASLALAWAFLGQRPLDPPDAPAHAPLDVRAFWREAPARWRMEDVPRVATRPWPVPERGAGSARP